MPSEILSKDELSKLAEQISEKVITTIKTDDQFSFLRKPGTEICIPFFTCDRRVWCIGYYRNKDDPVTKKA